jgi:hypothetical protein
MKGNELCAISQSSPTLLPNLQPNLGARIAQLVQRLATGWTVRGLNPGGGEIFRTFPDRIWGPPCFLYNGYRDIPGGKASKALRLPLTPSSADVKERVELYICGLF